MLANTSKLLSPNPDFPRHIWILKHRLAGGLEGDIQEVTARKNDVVFLSTVPGKVVSCGGLRCSPLSFLLFHARAPELGMEATQWIETFEVVVAPFLELHFVDVIETEDSRQRFVGGGHGQDVGDASPITCTQTFKRFPQLCNNRHETDSCAMNQIESILHGFTQGIDIIEGKARRGFN
jgi:hypothetical protein